MLVTDDRLRSPHGFGRHAAAAAGHRRLKRADADVARARHRARCAQARRRSRGAARGLLEAASKPGAGCCRAHARADRPHAAGRSGATHGPSPTHWRWSPSAATAAASSSPAPTSMSWSCSPASRPSAEERERLEQLIGMFWDIGLEIGHSVRTVEDCVETARARHHRRDHPARGAPARRQRGAVPAPFAARIDDEHRPGGLLPGEEARAGAAPREVPGHAVRARAQPQGEPRRPARPAGDPLDRARPAASAGTGATWRSRGLIAAGRSARLRAPRDRAAGPAHPPALPRRPARGPPRCSTTRTRSPNQCGLRGQAGAARQRTADAALLPHRQGDHAAQHHPAAEPARRASRRSRMRRRARSTSASRRAARCSRRGARTSSSASRARSSRAFLLMQQHGELRGMTARTLRALWRARGRDRRRRSARPDSAALFMQILQQPRGIVHEFRRMNQYGVLGRLPAGIRRASSARCSTTSSTSTRWTSTS